ncbi:carbohydrate ABC transporter permease [Arthrobacter sp. BE255]|uniref:carbohydrate ABC transporter permease n=1 Tax=Arthrobacter sp. BE255 TaxID=2817721 RepID=UPI0028583CC0|nr:carbohydrate ABC transporter permease [Arthrobacter sp. BE255]MDR7158385.1 ABC-type glycerol-3-phosphate transport system permease component [Arthrobacter sp. BE255]
MTLTSHRPGTQTQATPPEAPLRQSRERKNLAALVILLVVCAILFLPVLWLVLTSLKPADQLTSDPITWIPSPMQFQNFVEATTVQPFWAYAANSLFLSTVSGALTTISSALVGYGFARLHGKGKNVLFGILVAMMMTPPIITLIPTYLLFAKVGLVGTYWPWVLWGMAGVPYLIFLYRQFFAQLPRELEEAAILDGCGRLRIFAQIFLPLSKPVIITAFVLSFNGVWGDFIAPKLLLNQDNTTLAVAVTTGYVNEKGFPLNNLLAAGSVLYVIPVLIMFFFVQRSYVRGFATSGMK